MVLMLIYVALLPCCCLPATWYIDQSSHKQRITSQTYCPPCQLGKLPSSRISMDILAPVPKKSSNSVPQLIKRSQPENSLLTENVIVLRKIHPPSNDPPVHLSLSLIPPSPTPAVTPPTTLRTCPFSFL